MTEYAALYLPIKSGSDPSRRGFPTKEAAEAYMFDQMCPTCKAERARALAGAGPDPSDPDGWEPSEYPACSCEWDTCEVDEELDPFMKEIPYV